MFEILEFYLGKDLDLEDVSRRLVGFGYVRQTQAQSQGEFSIRGGIVDVYPLHFSLPVRIELSHETVESIHTYDPLSGTRLEPHRMVIVLPIKEGRLPKTRAWAKHLDRSQQELAQPVDPFVDIEMGDTVVHIVHGIARYRGIKSIKNAAGTGEDHFVLEFAERNILYVPTRDLHLIQRYVAFGKIRPKLSTLGSKYWERLKERTRKGVLSFAAELLSMQAKRRALDGFAFEKDGDWQRRLEEEFPYDETADQIKAWENVKADLESSQPMDRLLCGDVGFGKTEVALRAVFKVVMNGKQAAVLVPTTILAEQHFETFTERMKSFPVKIHMLSRFQTRGEQAETIRLLKEGGCDVVIGTHRLLSRDVSFKDLGLVVIDEEQRFGVKSKERLKRMRLLVDVLTLTATPIPRTLYMSLVGAKDMSTINTPPRNRRPIATYVLQTSDKIIQEAVRKELSRKGQVFFIHNRIEGIEAVAKHVRSLVPEARVAVGHGQMSPRDLEDIMHRFIHGEIDVLVSTTIVESGIDIPNANTMIVNRADLFGLSELYQLRGRVGRFDRDAHAYLLIPKGVVLTEESRRRLEAIEKFTYLGSGFNLAMEDLEIRGAGNILGTEQSGYISSVGFDLYCRMLKETVDALKTR